MIVADLAPVPRPDRRGGAALAVLAIVLGVTGPDLAHLYDTSGIATCHPHVTCRTLATRS